jgi:hypothetical protein
MKSYSIQMNLILSGGFLFDLIDEKDVKIDVEKNFGLLIAKRAGHSKVNYLLIVIVLIVKCKCRVSSFYVTLWLLQ